MTIIEPEKINTLCKATCRLNPEDICIGCYRHMSEIANWNRLTNDERLEVIEQANLRRQKKPYFDQDADSTRRITSVEFRMYKIK